LALEELHEAHVVYRDLKPENLVVNRDGFLKLIDFGLSTDDHKKAASQSLDKICGTPEYIAPEIYREEGYGYEADLWSFGCLLHKFLSGDTPFPQNEEQEKTRVRVIYAKPQLGRDCFSASAQSLLKQLLRKNPQERPSIEEIKEHAYFSDINFERLRLREVKAPYVPDLSSETDCQHFSADFTSKQIERHFFQDDE